MNGTLYCNKVEVYRMTLQVVTAPSSQEKSSRIHALLDTMTDFEFYAMFNNDKEFQNMVIDHARFSQPERCKHCAQIVIDSHAIACTYPSLAKIEEQLTEGRKKFANFKQIA